MTKVLRAENGKNLDYFAMCDLRGKAASAKRLGTKREAKKAGGLS